MFIIKFVFYFTISFLILAFPYNSKTIFEHVHVATYPMTTKIYEKLIAKIDELYSENKSKIDFLNGDKIHSKSSSISRREKQKNITNLGKAKKENLERPSDDYTQQERSLLNKILKETSY